MANTKAYLVPSIDRAMRVFELLAQSRRGFSISEISRKLALPKSSIHLVVGTLEDKGYLQKNAHNGRFCFGLKLVSLTRTALENLDLREEANPFLQVLVQKTGLTAHMAILEKNEAVIIEKVEAPGMLRLATWIGRRLDVNCSGVGKALIAFLPEAEFEQQLKTRGLAKHNENTIVSIGKLKRELQQVRQVGYAFDDEEDEIGFRCIGAPIFSFDKKPVAAISIAGTVSQIPKDRLAHLARLVLQTSADISLRIGHVKDQEA
jgi:DNA-binding IclR family transcriptional regulator